MYALLMKTKLGRTDIVITQTIYVWFGSVNNQFVNCLFVCLLIHPFDKYLLISWSEGHYTILGHTIQGTPTGFSMLCMKLSGHKGQSRLLGAHSAVGKKHKWSDNCNTVEWPKMEWMAPVNLGAHRWDTSSFEGWRAATWKRLHQEDSEGADRV